MYLISYTIKYALIWNAKITYIQILIPIFKYLDLGANHLYLSPNHLYLVPIFK